MLMLVNLAIAQPVIPVEVQILITQEQLVGMEISHLGVVQLLHVDITRMVDNCAKPSFLDKAFKNSCSTEFVLL